VLCQRLAYYTCSGMLGHHSSTLPLACPHESTSNLCVLLIQCSRWCRIQQRSCPANGLLLSNASAHLDATSAQNPHNRSEMVQGRGPLASRSSSIRAETKSSSDIFPCSTILCTGLDRIVGRHLPLPRQRPGSPPAWVSCARLGPVRPPVRATSCFPIDGQGHRPLGSHALAWTGLPQASFLICSLVHRRWLGPPRRVCSRDGPPPYACGPPLKQDHPRAQLPPVMFDFE
jgi:hypothetical protein